MKAWKLEGGVICEKQNKHPTLISEVWWVKYHRQDRPGDKFSVWIEMPA
jgi:hypothetical protein